MHNDYEIKIKFIQIDTNDLKHTIHLLQDDEPPEICVVEGAFTLQTLTPTQPMPSIEELDAKFAELVEELDLTAPNKAAVSVVQQILNSQNITDHLLTNLFNP